MKSEDKLFIELTNEEASSVTGGLTNADRVVAAIRQVAITGGTNSNIFRNASAVINQFPRWFQRSGNGFTVGDRKGSSVEVVKFNPASADVPNGWNWGVSRLGTWIAGGFEGPPPNF